MDATKLAQKVRRVLLKQIRQKGYETEISILTTAEINPKRLNITDTGNNLPPQDLKIKVVITSDDIVENATDIGDNPNEQLEFIVIEDGTEADNVRVEEGKAILYNSKRYITTLVSPATLAGQLIIKEVTAKVVR